MKRTLMVLWLVLLFGVCILISPAQASATVILNEFSSASSTEWVELYNLSDTNIDLSNYVLKNGSSDVSTLTGIIPAQGLLTFELNNDFLSDASGCLELLANGVRSDAIGYGFDYCPPGSEYVATAPTSTQSVARLGSGNTWDISPNQTRGWCNDSLHGCPSIASIVVALNAQGVSTNLGSMGDMTRISDLYFTKSVSNDPGGDPIGSISFSSELNFTNPSVLSWLSSLDSKLDMSTKGIISLDAELIKNLVDTRAVLTMYGLTLNNPEVLVDGGVDNQGVVSGLSYDKTTGLLTFNAAHFTTFSTREKQSSTNQSSGATSSPGPASPAGCDAMPPSGIPDLFQIQRHGDSATLYFSPVISNVSEYYISYGFSPGDNRFGVAVPYGSNTGVVSYTINELPTNTPISFSVRAGNGCATGGWSSWLTATKNLGTVHKY